MSETGQTGKRRRKKIFSLPLSINRHCRTAPYLQISTAVKEALTNGTLKSGDRLPSIRALARAIGVSPETVAKAYTLLRTMGLLESVRGSGCTVIEPSIASGADHADGRAHAGEHLQRQRVTSKRSVAAEKVAGKWSESESTIRPFITYASPMGKLAEKEYLRLAAHYARTPWSHTGYSSPQGHLPLREVIAERVREFKGIICEPEDIIITSGTTQNMGLISDVLLEEGENIYVEDPVFREIVRVLRFKGLNTVPVAMDEEGFDIDAACAAAPARAAVVCSRYQWPTGRAMSEARRKALFDWAAYTGGWIVEVDTNCPPWVAADTFQPLRAEKDSGDCVIYTESFSFQFYPGIRLGFIIAPRSITAKFAGAKYLTDCFTPESTQETVAQFLKMDAYVQYLLKLRKLYLERNACFWALKTQLLDPYLCASSAAQGPFITLYLPETIRDTEVVEALAGEGISVRAVSSLIHGTSRLNGIVLSPGPYSEAEIRAGTEKIRACLEALSQKSVRCTSS